MLEFTELVCVLGWLGGKTGIFANSPTGTTIVDGGTWERSDVHLTLSHVWSLEIKRKKILT